MKAVRTTQTITVTTRNVARPASIVTRPSAKYAMVLMISGDRDRRNSDCQGRNLSIIKVGIVGCSEEDAVHEEDGAVELM